MIIKKTTDTEEVRTVLCDPDVYDTITDDSSPDSDDFDPPIDAAHRYYAGYVNGVIIGVMIYHPYLDGNKCHVQVLPEYRKEHAKKFGEQSLLFKGTLPLYAEIPDLYKNVLAFALLNDFSIIKVKENDYIKNGQAYNVNVLRYK